MLFAAAAHHLLPITNIISNEYQIWLTLRATQNPTSHGIFMRINGTRHPHLGSQNQGYDWYHKGFIKSSKYGF